MAHAPTHSDYDFSPEGAIREIQSQRKRNSLIALGVGILAMVVFGAAIYLAYSDVPAPESPANARPAMVEPYR